MSMNWSRGLHRLFVVGCCCWALFILVVVPINESRQRLDFAAEYSYSSYDRTQEEREQRKKEASRLLQDASIAAIYKDAFKDTESIIASILALFAPPALFYGFSRGMIALFRWLMKGFA